MIQQRVVGRALVLVAVVAYAVAAANNSLTAAGEELADEALLANVRRPCEADDRTKVVLVGLKEIARIACVAADDLIDAVRVERRLLRSFAIEDGCL